jgi:hypothetical protein
LSGLELEYRLVQLSSIQTGERPARIEFNAGAAGAKGSQLIRQWKFDIDADGWGQLNDLELEQSHETSVIATCFEIRFRGCQNQIGILSNLDFSSASMTSYAADSYPARAVTLQANIPKTTRHPIAHM